MSTDSAARLKQLAQLLVRIESQARAATNLNELAYSIANDSYSLLGFRQALVINTAPKTIQIPAISGLVQPPEGSPYLVWLRRHIEWVVEQVSTQGCWLSLEALPSVPEAVQTGWQEWWTQGVYVLPIVNRQQQRLGLVVFQLDQAPQTWQEQALVRLAQSWGYCWEMLLAQQQRSRVKGLGRWLLAKKMWLALACIACMFIPVRLTALAPAEIISLDDQLVAAPIDGVVQRIAVRPNQQVQADQLLFTLDDTTLSHRLAVAQQAVAVADAEYITATQKAFQDSTSQSELALLNARAHEKRAELAAIQSQLNRVQVRAPTAGVAVYADPDAWLGRPVSTGERIMLLANPHELGVVVYLSVADAIALEPGADVKLFLKSDPLQPLAATVLESSHQAMVSPEGISSYRVRAALDSESAQQKTARIGLQGTAKVYGQSVSLGYYLLRRPLASFRAWTGW